MARKIIDVWPVLSVTPENQARSWTREEAEAAYREINEALKSLRTPYRLQIGFDFHEDARCEHCNSTWTAADTLYNDGCCDKDEASSPDRLQLLRANAEQVLGGDYFRVDEETGRRERVTASWPGTLAQAALGWLNGGRPADGVTALLSLINRVRGADYVTVWEDPGDYPSNAGAGPLPDQVSKATAPNDLADELHRLIDDMGLLPAREAA